MSGGFFQIGIIRGKTKENLGTLWRTAQQLGAVGIFTIGARYEMQASDTLKTYRHIPLVNYPNFDSFMDARPVSTPLIGVEMGGVPLGTFHHPRSAIYLLGSEDQGIPEYALEKCQHIVSIESVNTESFNVAVAGSIAMYSRLIQRTVGE